MKKRTGRLFEELVGLMSFLRSPKGCPWDREQTHRSLKPCLIEEAYEIADAVDSAASEKLLEELGDLLYIIIFYSRIAQEKGSFGIEEVIAQAYSKLKRRHPHVFGKVTIKGGADKVIEHWHRLKFHEAAQKPHSLLGGIPKSLPALYKAQKTQRKVSAAAGELAADHLKKVRASLHRLDTKDKRAKEKASGELFFALVNLCRISGIDPEEALNRRTSKFRSKFARLEKKVRRQGKLSQASLRGLWE